MGGSAGGGGAGNATMGTNAGNAGMGPATPADAGGLAALFANNRPTPQQSLPQIMQPTRPKVEYAPEPNPPYLTRDDPKPAQPAAGIPAFTGGLKTLFDAGAKQQGFKDSASQQGFLASLNQDQRNAYNRPDMRSSGSSIMSPTDPVWTQTNPEMMSLMTQWQMKEQFPQLFAAGGQAPVQQAPQMQPSASQLLAQQIANKYQGR